MCLWFNYSSSANAGRDEHGWAHDVRRWKSRHAAEDANATANVANEPGNAAANAD